MTHYYFKMSPGHEIMAVLTRPHPLEGYNTEADSVVNGKPYIMPAEVVGFTPFNPTTQVREGPENVVVGSSGEIRYTVRDKTTEELDADVAEAATAAALRIDTAAETARLAWVTGGGAMAMVYREKKIEAQAYQAVVDAQGTPEPSDYPLMQGRATRLSVTMQSVADEWNAKAAAWITAAEAVEAVREAAKEAVAPASTVAEVEAAETGLEWPAPS